MRYAVSHVSVIGHIWMPNCVCAYDYPISEHDVEMMRNEDGTITREDVEDWLSSHAGDFQSVDDFSAIIGDGENTLEFGWSDDENEGTYQDCMFGDEE